MFLRNSGKFLPKLHVGTRYYIHVPGGYTGCSYATAVNFYQNYTSVHGTIYMWLVWYVLVRVLSDINGDRKSSLHIGHEGPEVKYMYSSTLSLTSALDGAGLLTPRLGRFTPTKETGIHHTRGWVGHRPVWRSAESLSLAGIRSTDHPVRSDSLYRLSYPGAP
jgi:hypothetical protein